MGYVLKDLLTSKDFVQIGYSSGLTGYKGAIKVTPEEGVEYDVFDQLNLVYFLKDGMYVPHFIRERSAKGQTLKFERILTREDSRSEEHTSELQSRGQLVCRFLLEKKKGSDKV